MINTNKQIVTAISQPIYQYTASFFNDTLQENMDEAQFEIIQQVQGLGIQYNSDTEGRISYFYVNIGDKRLFVYQASSVMFLSGVVAEGALAITNEDGTQMNGAILGNAGSIFLAKFCATLVQQYAAKSEEIGNDPSEFNQEAYSGALTETLAAYAHVDANQYGRLLVMKQVLGALSEDERLTDE